MLTDEAATTTEQDASSEMFDSLDQILKTAGKAALIDRLIEDLDGRKAYRSLLDALLLKARFDLELPLIPSRTTADWSDGGRAAYEDRYVEAIRTVGGKILDTGDIAVAWPYYRAIGEQAPIVKAIDAYQSVEGDERLHGIVEVAFNQGANPRKGYELILKHYGTCSAVTAFEHLPRDEGVRADCAERLVKQLHEHLVSNLRAEIEHRGQPLPPQGTSIPDLMAGRDWLFADEAYHIDVSHLAATVRVGPLIPNLESLALALELAEYGIRLSPKHSYEGDPPFEQVYEDHAPYFRAVLGCDVDEGIAHFRSKLTKGNTEPTDENEISTDDLMTAQVLVGLLARIGRAEEALEVASEYLAGVPDSSLFCPGIAQLAGQAERSDKLAEVARKNGDLVQYAMAILKSSELKP